MGYQEIKPETKPAKKAYVSLMLWFVGRAIQAAAKTDDQVKKEFEGLPDRFTFSLGVMPQGPYMIVGKDKNGAVKYMGSNPHAQKVDLQMNIKNLEAAILLFTFQEGTAMASCRDRLILSGEVPDALAVVRILDIVEIYLLPEIVAKLAVKRYPKWWSPVSKNVVRGKIYIRTLLGI